MIAVPEAMRSTGRRRSSPASSWAFGTIGPGSAGASTIAVAVATSCRGLLVEADADGGVLGARYGAWLSDAAPSLASLLAALPTHGGPGLIEDHAQRLPGGARAVLVAADLESALGPVRRLAEDLGRLRHRLPGERVILDIGRVRPDTPSMMLAEQSDALIVVVRPEVESLGCLLARLPALLEHVPRLVVAVRGEGPYPLADIRAAIEFRTSTTISVVAVPEDPRGVKALSQARSPGRTARVGGRSDALMRAARFLASTLNGPDPSGVPSNRSSGVGSPADAVRSTSRLRQAPGSDGDEAPPRWSGGTR